MIQALIFDFDGLIVDTESPLVDAWVGLHAEHGLPCQRELMHDMVGHAGLEFDLWAAFGPDADVNALDRAYRERCRRLSKLQPVLPGVTGLLEDARARGLALGVASNSSHAHVEGHLARVGLLDHFDAIRCIDDVSSGKPAPDVYLAVLRQLGAAPAAALAFEDSVPGHVAAKSAGLRCVVVPNSSTNHFEFPLADLLLPSLAHTTFDELLARFSARTG